MKKTNIGSRLALYPMPVTVVGTMDGDKPEWLQIDHVGIIGHNRILVSMFQKHHTNAAIKTSGKLSINLVDRNLLPKADYVGSVSGEKVDKSEVFDFHIGEGGTPVIEASP
ncbi:MAG: NADPH-flavin oxidoreductase, partial [Bacteroides sp.]|nr:NADPH-flavin oxidoreductase [Bacteroides sp.]